MEREDEAARPGEQAAIGSFRCGAARLLQALLYSPLTHACRQRRGKTLGRGRREAGGGRHEALPRSHVHACSPTCAAGGRAAMSGLPSTFPENCWHRSRRHQREEVSLRRGQRDEVHAFALCCWKARLCCTCLQGRLVIDALVGRPCTHHCYRMLQSKALLLHEHNARRPLCHNVTPHPTRCPRHPPRAFWCRQIRSRPRPPFESASASAAAARPLGHWLGSGTPAAAAAAADVQPPGRTAPHPAPAPAPAVRARTPAQPRKRPWQPPVGRQRPDLALAPAGVDVLRRQGRRGRGTAGRQPTAAALRGVVRGRGRVEQDVRRVSRLGAVAGQAGGELGGVCGGWGGGGAEERTRERRCKPTWQSLTAMPECLQQDCTALAVWVVRITSNPPRHPLVG